MKARDHHLNHRLKLFLVGVLLFAAGAFFSLRGSPVATGDLLQQSFIWIRDAPATNGNLHAVFRRSFQIDSVPAQAELHLFAYTRYQLFVNGEYVGRGPNRFENRRPEYDSWDLAARLRPGTNVIAVLVHRDWPGVNPRSTGQTLSRFRAHAPGFTARLAMQSAAGRETVIASGRIVAGVCGNGLCRSGATFLFVRARQFRCANIPGRMDVAGVCRRPDLHSRKKSHTRDPNDWPVLSPRTIPLLRETDVPFGRAAENQTATLTNGGDGF